MTDIDWNETEYWVEAKDGSEGLTTPFKALNKAHAERWIQSDVFGGDYRVVERSAVKQEQVERLALETVCALTDALFAEIYYGDAAWRSELPDSATPLLQRLNALFDNPGLNLPTRHDYDIESETNHDNECRLAAYDAEPPTRQQST